MFLLVSGRHMYGCADLDVLQHGVSIQISLNLGKTFLCISCIGKIAVTGILARVFSCLPFFSGSDSGLYLLNGFDFYFDLF